MNLRYAVASALTALLMVPAAGAAAAAAPSWTDATPATIAINGGTSVTLTISAGSARAADVVAITAGSVPSFVSVRAANGNPATATLSIAAPRSLNGRFTLSLAARDSGGGVSTRTLTLVATPDLHPVSLVGPDAQSRWAYVLAKATARAAPTRSARVVATVGTATRLGRPNLVLALQDQYDRRGGEWVRVLLPVLPNGTTGWIPRSALDTFQVVATHLVIDRARLTARLYRNDIEVFQARIGIGRPGAPTPAGEFYVREKLRDFGDSFYGPIAFGTSARSEVLTDWPGGGFIGIHGTNQPQLLPGRVSHGCIRMRNADIIRLAQLMPLGTPVTIR